MAANYNALIQHRIKKDLLPKLSEELKAENWEIKHLDSDKIIATTKAGFFSWGETVQVVPLPDGVINISSECKLITQVIDWGKNKRNVNKVTGLIKKLEESMATE